MLMFKKTFRTKKSKSPKTDVPKQNKLKLSKMLDRLFQASVAKKLAIVTVISVVGFILVGGIGILSMYSVTGQMKKMYDENVTGIQLASDIERSVRIISEGALNFSAETDDKVKSELRQNIFQAQQSLKADIDQYVKIAASEEEEKIIANIQDLYSYYDDAINNLITAYNQSKAMQVYLLEVTPAQERIAQAVTKLVEQNSQAAQSSYEGSRTLLASTIVLFAVVLAVIIAISLFLNLTISKKITGALKRVNETVSRVAAGDLTVPELKILSNDEIGQLTASFNIMTANLRELLEGIIEGSDNLVSSAQQISASIEQESGAIKEIADAAQQLASGADGQRKKIEESMAYIEESSAAIEEISATAQEVASSTQQVSQKATMGNEAMGQAKTEMEKINSSTEEISGIISQLVEHSRTISNIVNLISGIAEQTNLLALNAAIEAARAGDQGRGFAVVAEEVRKLADQSQQAAKEIAGLIRKMQDDSVKAVEAMDKNKAVVENGSAVIIRGAEAFAEISSAVNDVLRQVQEVSRSTEELAKSSEEIVKVMEAIDAVTREVSDASHQVAANTEEQSASIDQLSSSAQFLSELGTKLQEKTSKFKL